MTLEEAILHCNEKSCNLNSCSYEHKQLANWLTELKYLRGILLENNLVPWRVCQMLGHTVRHFKGDLYLVTSMSEHTENSELIVNYTALYGTNKKYSRPLSLFESKVPKDHDNPTGQTYRFELQCIKSKNPKFSKKEN